MSATMEQVATLCGLPRRKSRPLIKGWDEDEADFDAIDELGDFAALSADGIATMRHVSSQERDRIAREAVDVLAGAIDRAGGLLDEEEFVRRCNARAA